jgi:hypothetical protein
MAWGKLWREKKLVSNALSTSIPLNMGPISSFMSASVVISCDTIHGYNNRKWYQVPS